MTIEESIKNFSNKELYDASRDFFHTLGIPIDQISSTPIAVADIFTTAHDSFKDVKSIYAIGMLNDAYFRENEPTLDITVKKDYQGILLFSIELSAPNPTRKILADISRAFNKEYHYTPVVILFKYDNKLSLSNTQRQAYKINKEGEKTGKVIILRDIEIDKPHRGHLDILKDMKIDSKVNSYESLYQHWQKVFDVSLLNKKFYQELSNWYSYAIQEVKFPNQPSDTDKEAIDTHKSQNVIRLLTRFLFVWFIKEKGLIPKELFDEDYIKSTLKDFNPKNMDGSLFGGQDKSSLYYKAILQNLFFASLNCPIKPLDKDDKRERGFRKKEHYGQNRDANFLMRYEDSFTNPQEFLELINSCVPFLNGGLFECLDDKTNKIYIDGFSDNLVKPHQLIVPDYLFFGVEEHVDLSAWYGSKNKAFKNATVKGLIKILDSYKFTVAENTPIEEDVALDPELLGRVFENLLASYNPETKTTARKQTGSFYTPREIVSYMVDESLIAYLKTKLEDTDSSHDLEEKLRELCSYSDIQPFEDEKMVSKFIISLDELKALDPAVGSGAFPMGMLQKMVHILSKLDPDNTHWKQLQKEKAQKESDEVFEKDDKEQRAKLLEEINNAFDETINNPDYARKLYIIENSIYGVDIQSVAIQISKLRFFISLVIEQNIDKSKPNFGVRPLPNLETKFISANTLIGIEKDNGNLFNDTEIKKLENKLKNIRHRLFNAKTPQTKRKLRQQDKELREEIAGRLEANGLGNESAQLLAHWDPYNQNASSPFFDMEWMFGTKEGFDIVIGNPPYHQLSKDKSADEKYKIYLKHKYKTSAGRLNLFIFFLHEAYNLTKNENGIITYIIPNTILTQEYYTNTRKKLLEESKIIVIVDYDEMPFENAVVENVTLVLKKSNCFNKNIIKVFRDNLVERKNIALINQRKFLEQKNFLFNINSNSIIDNILANPKYRKFGTICNINQGIALKGNKNLSLQYENSENKYYRLLDGRNITKYSIDWGGIYLDFNLDRIHSCKRKDIFETNEKLMFRRVSKDLIFTYDNEQYFALNTIIVVNKKSSSKDNLKALLAILNSKLMNFIYQKQFKSTKKVFSEIQARSVKELPISPLSISTNKILSLMSNLNLSMKKDEIIFSQVINGVVFELYFENHMKEKQINILEYVEKDIQEIMEDRDFESLDDASKEQVIQKLYNKWIHPDNEVRNRIKLFAVRSPDILKPILES